ncbi:metallophosphoesterase family protein [Marinihelvus fidelis]|nr:metallophosphoesterase family protein [Marinihelvus fidelis]
MYCIGDIHGRADLLEDLHGAILGDVEGFDGERHVLYLGDYIDRGTQSREVIDMLLDDPLPGFERIFLRGNHEQAMLDFMQHPENVAGWLGFGGRETLASYGVNVSLFPLMKELPELARSLAAHLPDTHLAFLDSGLDSWRGGDYFFAHAGIRPGVPLDEQHTEDLLWIRDEFLQSPANHGVVVVHGHTITTEPEMLPNRIGIDTGAFHSGVLTALVLEGTEQRLLQTGPEAA